MQYKDLRKLFHISAEQADAVYKERIASDDALHVPLSIAGNEAFCLVNPEVYRLIVKAERLDKEIDGIIRGLPGKAIEQYMLNCLIDEIVLTNEIEGVNSSRREIGEVLERLERNDKRGRFHGIAEKYLALQKSESIELATCADVRKVYDDLVLEEVVARDPGNAPDGTYFRAKGVDVLDASQKPIHHGIEPEGKLIEIMRNALELLGNRDIEVLVRVSLFHFIFGYAHPFYDGNGRMSRFLCSYVLSREFNPLVGFRLSYVIKDNIRKYYKGFTLCEHKLNRGDLTPFVILFSEMVVEAMESLRDSLADRRAEMMRAQSLVERIPGIAQCRESIAKDRVDLASLLIQTALFAEVGISMREAAAVMEVSEPTVYNRLDFFKARGLAVKKRVGHSVFYAMDMQALEQLARKHKKED